MSCCGLANRAKQPTCPKWRTQPDYPPKKRSLCTHPGGGTAWDDFRVEGAVQTTALEVTSLCREDSAWFGALGGADATKPHCTLVSHPRSSSTVPPPLPLNDAQWPSRLAQRAIIRKTETITRRTFAGSSAKSTIFGSVIISWPMIMTSG